MHTINKNILLLILLTTSIGLQAQSKIVGLVPARNESPIIQQCLRALALYTDAIVYLDDASTDDTLDKVRSVAQECNVEKIIAKEVWYRDEPGDRNKLLQAGRDIGGTHFIVIDADEMLTANCLKNNYLRKIILSLKPGDDLRLNWILAWKSTDKYRFDKSMWTYNYKDFIFCDDGKCYYNSEFLHTRRTPSNLSGKLYTLTGYTYGMLHFQFVNWRNLLVKQFWYHCLERIRQPNKSDAAINARYAPTLDTTGVETKPAPSYWFDAYTFFDPSVYKLPEEWREKQVVGWFDEYGRDHFAGLNIWDINWGSGI